jgi:hypothetical protein
LPYRSTEEEDERVWNPHYAARKAHNEAMRSEAGQRDAIRAMFLKVREPDIGELSTTEYGVWSTVDQHGSGLCIVLMCSSMSLAKLRNMKCSSFYTCMSSRQELMYRGSMI